MKKIKLEGQNMVNEISLMKKLSHPNVVKIHEDFVVDGILFLIMEKAESGFTR